VETGKRYRNTDFATTLGVYGIPSGPYLVLPFLGQRSLRGWTGYTGDILLNRSEIRHANDTVYYTAIKLVNLRSLFVGVDNKLRETSLDYYTTIRNVTLQGEQRVLDNSKRNDKPANVDIDFDDSSDEDLGSFQ
jgi:phospholipid-binding lipoprotein MlaA